MTDIKLEKELIFVKLIRKGPHILEFSNDYLMVHNGKIAFATATIKEKYFSVLSTDNREDRMVLGKEIASLINDEYYKNKNVEWYSLREYIDNFTYNRLEEFKRKIS